jgi:putative phage-type endonuclease
MSTYDTVPPEIVDDQEAWMRARVGKATASRIADAVRRAKTSWSASRATYRMELIAERLTGMKKETYVSQAMAWGLETEKHARDAYETRYGTQVATTVLFVSHPSIKMSGASPDGFVGLDGLFECKCPETRTHIETLLNKEIDPDYIKQMQWQMACAGCGWCDFVSFDPRLPLPLQLYVERVYRDDVLISSMEEMVKTFLTEIDESIVSLGEFIPLSAPSKPEPAAEMGWSENVPDENFSGIDGLLKRGLIKKGLP